MHLCYYNTCKEQNLQVRKEGRQMNEMTKEEQRQLAIEKFAAIQRIKKYGSDELDYQERLARAELQTLGISTEDLELK